MSDETSPADAIVGMFATNEGDEAMLREAFDAIRAEVLLEVKVRIDLIDLSNVARRRVHQILRDLR